jgi:hypothetical protein
MRSEKDDETMLDLESYEVERLLAWTDAYVEASVTIQRTRVQTPYPCQRIFLFTFSNVGSF